MAEVEELTANPDAEASGVVIESKLDPGRGAVVTVLVQRGTLKIGDALVAGAHWGRVRAMSDYTGKRVKEAGPSEPVEVLGFDTVPEAGEYVRVVENDRKARSLAGERANRLKLEQQARRRGSKVLAGDDLRPAAAARSRSSASCSRRTCPARWRRSRTRSPSCRRKRSRCTIVRSGVGGITESDINLAAASDAIVIGFNVRPVGDAAPARGPRGRRDPHLLGHLPRDRRAARRHAGHARAGGGRGRPSARSRSARSSAPRKIGMIAGCKVTDGKVTRGAKVRLVRDGAVVYDGEIGSLRRVQRRRARGRDAASSAASCSRTSRTSRRATRWRSTRRGRSSARCPKLRRPASPRSSCSCACTCTSRNVGSLKGKRAELNRVKALLRERLGASVAEVAHQDSWQRSTLAVARRGALPGALRGRRGRDRARAADAASAGRCASSGGSRPLDDLESLG